MSTHKIKTAADIIKMMHGEFASIDGKVNEPVTNAMNRYADMLDAAFARQGIGPSADLTGKLRLPDDPGATVCSNTEVRTAVDKMCADQTRLVSAVSDVRDIAANLPLLESSEDAAS